MVLHKPAQPLDLDTLQNFHAAEELIQHTVEADAIIFAELTGFEPSNAFQCPLSRHPKVPASNTPLVSSILLHCNEMAATVQPLDNNTMCNVRSNAEIIAELPGFESSLLVYHLSRSILFHSNSMAQSVQHLRC